MPATRNVGFKPSVKYAPLYELKIYPLNEYELDRLAQGSASGIWLNFSLALLPMAIGILVTMRSSQLSETNFILFSTFATIFIVIGLMCLVIFWKNYSSSKSFLSEIKARIPSPEPTLIEEEK